jgi:hypothetical protein
MVIGMLHEVLPDGLRGFAFIGSSGMPRSSSTKVCRRPIGWR